MPVILFDQQIFKQQKFGGISRYFSRLMDILSRTNNYRVLPGKYFSANQHLSAKQTHWYNDLHHKRRFRGQARVMAYLVRKSDKKMRKLISGGQYDVFHPTYYRDEFLEYIPANKPFVITVYDMIHELYYEQFFKTVNIETKQKANLLPKADHIIAISEHTKKDILTLFPGISEKKISVVHLGYEEPGADTPVERQVAGDYILFVGGRWHYKNFQWTLKAASSFLKENDMRFVCAGGGPFNDEELRMIREQGLEEHVQFCDIKEDAVLNAFYRDAFCFIFPSLYEGFGLPILESYANNCPVILSNATCFPEIGGDAALYFETEKEQSLLNCLTRLKDNDSREALIKAGKERLKSFSWDKTAKQHMEIYEQVIKENLVKE